MNKLISFDFAIKYLLRDKGNYDIIEGFISALLVDQGYKPVKILALLDTESNKETFEQKKSLADLIVEDTDHAKYIIEIERQTTKGFIHKSCFNTSRLIVDQLDAPRDYLNIKKVFHISLLYFRLGNGTIYHGKTIFHETESKEKLNFHIEDKERQVIYDAIDILPEYIFISIPQFDDHLEKEMDEWLYVMKHEDVRPEFKSPYMSKVAARLSVLNMTTEMRNEYINYNKQIVTYNDAIDTAEQKGLEKGIKEGLEKGIRQEKVVIAKRLLLQNIEFDTILSVTGLRLDELEKLKREL